MYQYHQRKRGEYPITVQELIEMGIKAHGRSLWKEASGERELVLFDSDTREFVSPPEFASRQQERACQRARSYPNGRKKVSSSSRTNGGLYSFPW